MAGLPPREAMGVSSRTEVPLNRAAALAEIAKSFAVDISMISRLR
jgi:hypothetical protein